MASESSALGKIRIPIAQKASGQLLGSSCAAAERQHLLTALAETSLQLLRVSYKELALCTTSSMLTPRQIIRLFSYSDNNLRFIL